MLSYYRKHTELTQSIKLYLKKELGTYTYLSYLSTYTYYLLISQHGCFQVLNNCSQYEIPTLPITGDN